MSSQATGKATLHIFKANFDSAFYKSIMEHYFRTALWMLFLIGCFQAASIARVDKKELGVKLLRKDVKIEVS